jgi:hypothetical protein
MIHGTSLKRTSQFIPENGLQKDVGTKAAAAMYSGAQGHDIE